MRFPNIMLRIARISRRRCHSFDEKQKGISKIRVAEDDAATFKVTERKAKCMRLSSHTAPKW